MNHTHVGLVMVVRARRFYNGGQLSQAEDTGTFGCVGVATRGKDNGQLTRITLGSFSKQPTTLETLT